MNSILTEHLVRVNEDGILRLMPKTQAIQMTAFVLSIVAVLYVWLAPIFWSPTTVHAHQTPARNGDAWSFFDHVQDAQVSYGEHECTHWTGNRWDCQLQAWLWVGRYLGKVTQSNRGSFRRCIWAHPRTIDGKSQSVDIRFPEVVLGTSIRGEAAIMDVPHHGTPAHISVYVDDTLGQKIRLRDRSAASGDGWKKWSFKTEKAEGERAEIRFEISARNAAWRQLCFTAFVERSAAP
ncbi:MAG TPA: hypothetical protein EYN66_22070 [Myxococcales bacterium]|nr:hypothetical protein [Myxococcales bacterium]